MISMLGTRRALVLAVIFAAFVVAVSMVGQGLGPLLSTALPAVALLVALYFVVRRTVAAGVRDAGRGGAPSAREVLDGRYARGEIGDEEYQRMRSRLETT